MKISKFTSREPLLAFAVALLPVGALFGACAGEFTYGGCPEGTEQTAGGGDIKKACTPVSRSGGAAGAGGGDHPGGAGGGSQAGAAGGNATAGGGGTGGGDAPGSGAGAGGARSSFTIEQVALSAGSRHTCVSNPSALYCWGLNRSGQIGSTTNLNTSFNTPNPVPVLVASAALGSVRQLALGDQHSCALRDDGRVLCWGLNRAGQLGTDANVESFDGTPVPALIESGPLGAAKQVAAGYLHGCALRDDGRVLCWGNNYFGQLGISANTATETPTPEPALLDVGDLGVVRQVSLGERHTCALRNDGRVLCWGKNHSGQLGVATNIGSFVSTPALLGNAALGVVRQVAVGLNHGCALRDDGRVLCWGDNYSGQLGNSTNVGTTAHNATPTLLNASALGVVRQLALGGHHSCALRDDGRVLCWGANEAGQLAVANPSGSTVNPIPTLLNNSVLGNVYQLVAGQNHTCALRDDGQVLCWGDNRFGQLGTNARVGSGEATFLPTPVQELPPLIP